jgi:hypothetical protein
MVIAAAGTMRRTASIAVVLVASCASNPDTRPQTAEYIIEAVLMPYCGRGSCHSTNTAAHSLVFDTIPASLDTLSRPQRNEVLVVPGVPEQSRLYTVLRDSGKIMPPDQPLPDKDRTLIYDWIANGAAGL